MDIYIYMRGYKLAKFHGNIFSPSETTAKTFRRGRLLFYSHCTHVV